MDKEALKLKAPLQFWYQHQPTKENFNESLLPVAQIDTAETFWSFYQHFKRPSQISENSSLFLFKKGIKPVWEDPANQYGGEFLLKFQQAKADKVCEDILLSFVVKNVAECQQINGIRLKVKKGQIVVQIWVRECSQQGLQSTRDWIINATCLNPQTQIQFVKFHHQ